MMFFICAMERGPLVIDYMNFAVFIYLINLTLDFLSSPLTTRRDVTVFTGSSNISKWTDSV